MVRHLLLSLSIGTANVFPAAAQPEIPVFSKTGVFFPAWRGHVRRVVEIQYSFSKENGPDSSKTVYTLSANGDVRCSTRYMSIPGRIGKPKYWSVEGTMKHICIGSVQKGRVAEIQTSYDAIYDESDSSVTTWLFNPAGSITGRISVSKNAAGAIVDSSKVDYQYNSSNNIVTSHWYGFRNNAAAGRMKVSFFRSDTVGWQQTEWKYSASGDTLFQITRCSDTAANDSFYRCRVPGKGGYDSVFYYHLDAEHNIRHFDSAGRLITEERYAKGKRWLQCTHRYDAANRLIASIEERPGETTTRLLEYGPSGLLYSETTSRAQGEDRIEYPKYEKGNCLEEWHYYNGELRKKIVRTISYY